MRGIAEAVRETGGRRFIQDAHDFQTCELSGLPRSVALGVRKIGGESQDRPCERVISIALSPLPPLAKKQGGDLPWPELPLSLLHCLRRTPPSVVIPAASN